MRRTTRRRARMALLSSCFATALAVSLCGCFVVGEQHILDEPFTEKQVRMIRHGETPKKAILDWFGPPAALAREGARLNAPLPGPGRPGPEEATMEGALRRFAKTNETLKDHVVYYYYACSYTWADICVYSQYGGGCSPTTPVLKVRKLWILIDEKTGNVADHYLEETTRKERAAAPNEGKRDSTPAGSAPPRAGGNGSISP